ncbi:MAG: hypothetical protein M1822_004015 [Bathelium mastoideum]|nr:MAG: hypothetical protein M1822_004015 [Bathelium mastoideum]
MPGRKRKLQETAMADTVRSPEPVPENLRRLRNMWEFASLMQYLYLFGKAVKIDDDLDIDELEQECIKPTPSERLSALGLALLKFVSSHRGLTLEIFDEYTRRQYLAKAPHRNPFGEEETPNKFDDFDLFTKIRVLHQLSTWTFTNPDRIRERMSERDYQQTSWRMEPQGWDAEDRAYFVLDDDRLYRQTEAPLPPTPTKAKSKSKSKPKHTKATRSNKRRKISRTVIDTEDEDESIAAAEPAPEPEPEPVDDGFGGRKWECIAITLEDYQEVLEDFRRSRHPAERQLHKILSTKVLPVIEQKAEAQTRKAAKKQRELENLQKMATAKRSSRLADKQEKQKQDEEAAAAEHKRQSDLAMARKEQEKQQKMEAARESRMMTREQRLKEREVKRILHEEELARLEEDSKKIENGDSRISERHLKAEMEKRQRELEKLTQEDDWVFDCAICGMHGENLVCLHTSSRHASANSTQDDGSHSIACEKCSVWQHSKCHGIAVTEAERDDFHFVCADCKRRDEEAKRPKTPSLKIRLSSSPKAEKHPKAVEKNGSPGDGTKSGGPITSWKLDNVQISPPRRPETYANHVSPPASVRSGPSLSPHGQGAAPPGMYRANGIPDLHQPSWNGHPPDSPARPSSSSQAMGLAIANGMGAGSPSPSRLSNGFTNGIHHTPANHAVNGTSPRPLSSGIASSTNDPFHHSFIHQQPPSTYSRPTAQSPIKQPPPPSHSSPQPSPVYHSSPFTASSNPSTSFPPTTAQHSPRFNPSPVKHHTTNITSPPQPAYTPQQQPAYTPPPHFQTHPSAGLFPPSVPPPAKHEPPQPLPSLSSSTPRHSLGAGQGLPPAPALSPSAQPMILDPPVKRTPEGRQ